MADAKTDKNDERYNWVVDIIRATFPHIQEAKFPKAVTAGNNVQIIQSFLNESDQMAMCVFGDVGIQCAKILPKKIPTRIPVVVFLKLSPGKISEKIAQEVFYFEMNSEPLDFLESTLREVYIPLLQNPRNQEGWGEMASKEVVEKLHSFLSVVSIMSGDKDGKPCLPLPPAAPESEANKDTIHLLESAIVTWSKQIKTVLSMDPESHFKRGENPTPDLEISFWRNKAHDLNCIYDQLQSEKLMKVLIVLDKCKSTYSAPFSKLIKEVITAREEANDNVRYLRPLEPWLDKLMRSMDFVEMAGYFRPLLCTLLRVWKYSGFYNSTNRVVILLREICNALIQNAQNYINGQDILRMLEEEDVGTPIMKLKMINKICRAFKTVFFDYRALAREECPENPWSFKDNAIFLRLDTFMERIHDVLDMTETIVMFSKLSRIEIGGTKGKTLTSSVQQIHADFMIAVESLKKIDYEMMDVGAKQFDDDFFTFQCKIKELERRLASILTQGFDDCPSLSGRFSLLDSFEGLLERPIIMDELEKKHILLVQSFGQDLKTIQETFLREKDDPPISSNLPPIAGALSWSKALLERIADPMEKLTGLSKTVMEREESKEVVKMYEVVVNGLEEYRLEKINEWGSDVDATSQAKLKLPLLRRNPDNHLLQVNFDPDLVKLLREVKYFLHLKLEVPKEALSIYRRTETFRQYTGNLDLIVAMYNSIVETLIPVEEPLIASYMEKVESTIKRGIDNINWQSTGIEAFISESKSIVGKAHEVLFTLKGNLGKIEALLASWAEKPMIERLSKPVTPEEFDESHRTLINKRYDSIKKNAGDIQNLVKESFKVVQTKCQAGDWKAYVEYVNGIVSRGLIKVILGSLKYLNDQVDPAVITKFDKLPVLEIELDLINQEAIYVPNTTETRGKSVKDIVTGWVNDFMSVGALVKTLTNDGAGDYLEDIKNDPEVKSLLESIMRAIDGTNNMCENKKEKYTEFSYLWTDDLDKSFAKFIENSQSEVAGTKVPLFDRFDAEIQKYSEIKELIEKLPSPIDVGWVRVNSHPIKQALITWVTRWIYLYTKFLEDFVIDTLSDLQRFMAEVQEGLLVEVTDSIDNKTLKSIMTHIRNVRNRSDQVKAVLDPVREAFALLKKHNVSLDSTMIGPYDIVSYMDEAPLQWDKTVNITFKKKEEIMPYQNNEVDSIKRDADGFYDEIREFRAEFKKNAPFSYKGSADDAYVRIHEFALGLTDLNKRSKDFSILEDLFELPNQNYREIEETLQELLQLKLLWDLKGMISFTFNDWEVTKWSNIDTDLLSDRSRDLMLVIRNLGSRTPIIKAWQVYRDCEDMIRNMTVVLPLIQSLHSPAMQDRHWVQLATICGVETIDHKSENFCFKDILELGLHLHVEDIVELVEIASKELKIEQKLNGIENAWVTLLVEFEPHKDTDVMNLKVPDEVIETLEAHQLELQSMISMGRFVDYFRDRVDKWQKLLGTVETVLKTWLAVTQQWTSLESIFLLSEDIAVQLPEDTKSFRAADQKYRQLMLIARDQKNALQCCTMEGRLELLQKDLLPVLEKCQKSLTEYLDMKKKMYPRFYFVSNVALLDMLSNGNRPPSIMQHLGDCYAAIDKIRQVGDDILSYDAMISKDHEMVEFPEVFHVKGNVEYWLNDLTDMMINCLTHVIDRCVTSANFWNSELPREKWLFDYPAQAVLAVAQLFWTEETEKALSDFEGGNEEAVKDHVKLCTERLEMLIHMVQGKLSKEDRIKIIALITMDVHNRDVVQKLINVKAEGPSSFQWQQQLRFYYNTEMKKLLIRITDYRTEYSYEYVGNNERLVITPLTDRCYMTLTMALRLMLGGAPAGPAGTGKTETTKDLAKALARPIYVFNCSDQMNYQTMADIFKGLSQTGAWGCFDEFNRICIEVLSVVASQVKQCLQAIVYLSNKANREEQFKDHTPQQPLVIGYFHLDGDRIRLIPTTGFFITMNPGYAGRTELPENVKALFRACAMIRPDLEPICENMLMAEGFVTARILSIKFVTLYSLSSELLSKQHHYDWGLRSVKSVLRVAGAMKRANPDMGEEAVLMRALRDFNTPKMPVADLPIFLRLIQDLFPESYKLPVKVNEDLKKKGTQVCKNTGLQPEHSFLMKVIQYQELLDVRHSVMLIGPAGCGKTTVWKTLLGCHNLGADRPVAIAKVINPKALTSNELYGYMTMTREWKDGVISIIMRGMSKNMRDFGYHTYQTTKWVVLDGDIDAVWIESMNTVMDDNKVLTLVSNERVPLTEAMRMIFEVNSLKNASPATVSRAGILYVNETDIGWHPFVESWIATKSSLEQECLPVFFEKYVVGIIEAMGNTMKTIVPLRVFNKVSSVCNLMDGFMLESKTKEKDVIEMFFIQSVVWAFGGATSNEKMNNYRKSFSDLWRNTFTDKFQYPVEPSDALVFDFYLDYENKKWSHWSEKIVPYQHVPISTEPGDMLFFNISVSTLDTTRFLYLFKTLNSNGNGAMLVGPAGTGKTRVMKDYFAHINENFQTAIINMNYYTNHAACQALIEQKIDKRSGVRYGPPPGKKMIYFVDDMNMPRVEEYGSQGALALVKLVIDHKILYDRVDPGLRKIVEDVIFMGSMNPTAGSFTICERVQRHFTTFSMDMPTQTSCANIYSSILSGHLSDFEEGVQSMVEIIVSATISLHEKIQVRFLPSAIKFVYNWNMREISNIVHGLCHSVPAIYQKPIDLIRLWVHECNRVFSDRMISEEDINRYNEAMQEVTKQQFVDNFGSQADIHALPLIFTSFHTPQLVYQSIPSGDDGFTALNKCLSQKLTEYNESNSIMDLVLFSQAMEHITRICRILDIPQGHALLVGVGGSGKQSLSKLSSFICGHEVRQLSITSTFGITDLMDTLKDFYMLAGVKNTSVVWIVTDSHIVDDRFLVYINDVLSSGYVPNLFAKDELEGIFNSLRGPAKAAGIASDPASMMSFFIERVQSKLHLVLCFSPAGDTLRVRARRFPGIINCTVIDWFHEWPKEALISVAQRFLRDVESFTPELRENISNFIASVHVSVIEKSLAFAKKLKRYNYVTPRSFLEMITYFKSLLDAKLKNMAAQINRLSTGLATLQKTGNDVAELQIDLQRTMIVVEEKRQATSVLLDEMGTQKGEAEIQQQAANIEKEKADTASKNAAEIEAQASKELEEATPAMEAAKAAVDCLDKNSLTELKNFSSPPAGVDLVTNACLMMLQNDFKNLSWDKAKKMMKDVITFMNQLKAYQSENMSDQLVKNLTPIVNDPLFTYDNMARKSSAAANLCLWVASIFRYNRIYVKVKPLMDRLEQAQGEKAAAEQQLAGAIAKVEVVEKKLKELEEKYTFALDEKNKVEAEAARCKNRLDLAERLVGGLSSENTRWGAEVEKLHRNEVNITGDVLLGSAFVSYVGGFDQQFRQELWKDSWIQDLIQREIPISDGLDPMQVITDDASITIMQQQGLPSDRMSVENGCICSSCSRWPLIIDPQLQGIKWLRGKFPTATCIQLSMKNWQKKIQGAIQMGGIIIIENVQESIDHTLDPLLARAIYKKGRSMYLRFCGEEIEYDMKFKMILQCKLSNPHYQPETQAQCTLINFIATERGLEDQLLAKVVNEEKPSLEEMKQELQRKLNDYKIRLIELEDTLLSKLSNAPDDILSDEPLIIALEETKKTAAEITLAVEKAKETEIEINRNRDLYRPVASEGAMLYFMLTKLCSIEHMYQYSLDAFAFFFYKAIKKTPAQEKVDDRVIALRDVLRLTVYTWISRGLYEDHKLIVMTLLVFQLMSRKVIDVEYTPQQMAFLMRAPKKLGEENQIPWLSAAAWNTVQALAELDEFHRLPADMVEASSRFKEWFTLVNPEDEKLPLDWSALDKQYFQKMLVVRALRPDRMTASLNSFVRQVLPNGSAFADCDATYSSLQILQQCLLDSNSVTPIYFILSPGADVSADLDKLATQNGMVTNISYHNVSMGQGQDMIAMNRLEVGHKEGHWVVLHNVHLMPRWLIELEKRLDAFALEGSHENFRVFLTSDPSSCIPIGILNRCIKLTNEPPTGLKANLKRAFCSLPKEGFDELDGKVKSIIFALCHFHAVLIERKKFGPKGFNMMYPFNLGDLRDSRACLMNYMEENSAGQIPWEDLRYIFGQIMYGGHIVNDLDRVLCMTYLDFYMKDGILEECELFPFCESEKGVSFKTPLATSNDRYIQYIDENIKGETPLAYGLNPNAEIDYKTTISNDLFEKLQNLDTQTGDTTEGESAQALAQNKLVDILDKFGETKFEVEEVSAGIEEKGPFQNVFLQECERVNILLDEMRRSLKELNMGFDGELTMSDQMDHLYMDLFLDKVPSSWTDLAWPSMRALGSWIKNLEKRIEQLHGWITNPMDIPTVTWLSGLGNPQSFLTAILQQTAQKTGQALDCLLIQTDITKLSVAEVEEKSRDGCYIHGLYLEGARWDSTAGIIDKALPREMFCLMPVICCRAVAADKMEANNIYQCPCYRTEQRGPTFVFYAQLRTKSPSARWVMAGAALLLDIVE